MLPTSLIRAVKAKGIYHRVLIGTDTPGGTGIIPRGILREIAFISSVGEVGPDHDKRFIVEVKVGSLATRGEGSSKKEAQQQAAKHALREFSPGA